MPRRSASLITRRRVLTALSVAAVSLTGARILLPAAWRTGPVGEADDETVAFVRRCFEGVRRDRMVDTHVHLAGTETSVTGCWMNPRMKRWTHPAQRLRYEIFMGAAGVEGEAGGDAQYVARLLERHRAGNPDGQLLVMGFERFHDDDGKPDLAKSVMHVPDGYVLQLAQQHHDLLACVSIHPYAPDAVERLEAAVEQGARAIKWLPSAMNIDPSSPRCAPFYAALARLKVPVICHAGEESALTLVDLHELNNPLRLRTALDAGVTVVVAHLGSLGHCADLDAGAGSLPCFDAFLRMFGEERHERRLLADLSALVLLNRSGRVLRETLALQEEQHRLVNGSDYPVCAVDPLTSTLVLKWQGYLDAEDQRMLESVFELNPLLFDFCLKRCLRSEQHGTALRFSPAVFETSWLFERPA